MRKTSLMLSLALLTSCASNARVEDELAGFMGNKIEDVYQHIGRPTQIYNMQDGTWQYLWTSKSGVKNTASTSFMGVPLVVSRSKECTRVLVVNRRKIVVGYDTEGKC